LRLAAAAACLVTTAAAASAGQRPVQALQILPLTQLDDRAASAELDDRTFTLTIAEPSALQDVLLQVTGGTGLSIVLDPGVEGSFVGELKNVTVRQALGLILASRGLDYSVDGTFVRVFRRQLDTRIFDVNYIAAERQASSRVGVDHDATAASVSTSAHGDVFTDIANGVGALLSDRATFNVDRKAGLLQATDVPERLDRVAAYLDAVQDRMQRQAQIDVRVLEVALDDDHPQGVDWTRLGAQLSAAPPDGRRPAARATLTGMRVTDVDRLLTLLAAQGTVSVIASPRLLTLNNEPAIVRSDAVTMSVTPQIAGDSALTLSLSPIVGTPAIAESDMLARVADGETLVVSGFRSDRETRERRTVGAGGGWFGRGTVVTRRRVELVILLTPRIIAGAMAQ
jgi:type II secretory pathway component GspD/PulD (secretin)